MMTWRNLVKTQFSGKKVEEESSMVNKLKMHFLREQKSSQREQYKRFQIHERERERKRVIDRERKREREREVEIEGGKRGGKEREKVREIETS